MVRSAEFFGLEKIFIYDKHGLLEPPKNKADRADMEHMAKVWTAGAIDHIQIEVIDDIHPFFRNYQGRKIATVVDDRAEYLQSFQFQNNDLIVMGPEKEGLPFATRTLCDHKVFLPNQGETECLNVSVMLGILLYKALTD